MISEGSSERLE